jgi:hypothetical protein
LVLCWDINADWQYDPMLKTEVEVRFIADGEAFEAGAKYLLARGYR